MNKENRLVKKQFDQFVRLMIFSHIDLELKMIRKTRRNTFEYPKDKKDYDRYAKNRISFLLKVRKYGEKLTTQTSGDKNKWEETYYFIYHVQCG